jgi:hypothetical protein
VNAQTEVKAAHPSVFAAVVAAKAAVKRVAKENRNTEQKYEFASIDDFLAMVGPVTAAHGLLTVIDEDSLEFIEKQGKYGPTQWVRISYQITTYHAGGTHLPTVRRNIEVIRSGPQAYGSAQSYVLKQYYRGLLDIPTGDKDDPDFGGVDHSDRASREPPARAAASQRPAAPAHRPDPSHNKPSPADHAISALLEAKTVDDLAEVWRGLSVAVKALPEVIGAKDLRKDQLREAADA